MKYKLVVGLFWLLLSKGNVKVELWEEYEQDLTGDKEQSNIK